MNDTDLLKQLTAIVSKQNEVLVRLAQGQDASGFITRALNTAIGNTGGIYSQFHSSITKTPGAQNGNVTVADNWTLTVGFTPPLAEPVKHKVMANFMALIGRSSELAGKVSLVFA
jgi:hypothetical protein